MQILVVEDERKVADALREGLEAERYDVTVERNGHDAFVRIKRDAFDLVLLDLGLPGRDGLDMLRAIRARDVQTRVLLLTARDALHDKVAGLNAGADDYLVKPFAFAELLARVRALLRRGSPCEIVRLNVGTLTLDRTTRCVTRGEDAIELTTREFELLECLMRYHIARLRRKVDADQPTRLIHTVRGVGFMLKDGEP